MLAFFLPTLAIYLDGASNENVAVNFYLWFLAGIVAQTHVVIFIAALRKNVTILYLHASY